MGSRQAVQATPGGRPQSHYAQLVSASENGAPRHPVTPAPRHPGRAEAAARARALRGPAPAPQHCVPRVACCRRHRFPTCTRALWPLGPRPQALEDRRVGRPRAGLINSRGARAHPQR